MLARPAKGAHTSGTVTARNLSLRVDLRFKPLKFSRGRAIVRFFEHNGGSRGLQKACTRIAEGDGHRTDGQEGNTLEEVARDISWMHVPC